MVAREQLGRMQLVYFLGGQIPFVGNLSGGHVEWGALPIALKIPPSPRPHSRSSGQARRSRTGITRGVM